MEELKRSKEALDVERSLEIAQLRERLSKETDRRNALTQEFGWKEEKYLKDIESLKGELVKTAADLGSSIGQERQIGSKLESDLETMRQAAKVASERHLEEIAEYQRRLEKEKADRADDQSSARSRIGELQERLAEWKATLSEKEQQVEQLQKQLVESRNNAELEMSKLRDVSATEVRELAQKSAAMLLEAQQKSEREMKEARESASASLAKVQTELEDSRVAFRAKEQQYRIQIDEVKAQLYQHISELKSQNEEALKEKERTQAVLQQEQKQAESLREKVKELEQSEDAVILQLRNKIEGLKQEKEALDVEKKRVEAELMDFREKYEFLPTGGDDDKKWLKDKEVPYCPLCTKDFNAFRRRHHCR